MKNKNNITLEWLSLGLPGPEGIDKLSGEWIMSSAEYHALTEMMRAEAFGRLRIERYQRWICESAGITSAKPLHIVVEPTRLNS